MFVYIFPYIIVLFIGFFSFSEKIKLNAIRFLFFISLLPAFFLVVFRGDIETDTKTYESIIEQSYNGNCVVEPLFCLFSNTIFGIVEKSDITLRIITAIFCLLFYLAFAKTKRDIVIASFFIFPVFFYDMATNGIRYGLAFILFKILYDKLSLKSVITMPIYLNIQVSSFLLVILNLIKKLNYKSFFMILFFMICLLIIGQEYFIAKLIAYSEYTAPNFYSGILNFLLGLLIIITFRYFKKISLKEFLVYFLLFLSFQILTQFSYAGLRLIQLMLFYFSIRSISLIKISNFKSDIIICFVLFITGFIYFINLLRIMDNSGRYMPYEFIF